MPRRSPLRSALLTLCVAALAWLVVELAAGLALRLAGEPPGELRRRQGEVAGTAAGEGGGPAGPQESPATSELLAELRPGPGAGNAEEVIHPFLGFVTDPGINRSEQRRQRHRLEVTPQGFFRPPGPPPARDPHAYRVGVFGGSVAFLLSFEGRDRLHERLAASPRLAGRPVEIESFALGGYKQPQQLATLAYLLALGHRLDAVVELDGFNEVMVPRLENAPQRVALAYPLDWPQRVGGLQDAAAVRDLGRLLELRRRRGGLAAGFARRPWRWSLAALALWRWRDGRLAAAQADLESRLDDDASTAEGFLAHGPFQPVAGDSQVYRRAAGLWRRSSLQMARLCRANGILYLHFLQPNQYVPGSKPMGAVERARAFRADHPYRRTVVEGYPYLQRAGRRLRADSVEFHDLTGIFAGVDEPLYWDTCCHLGREGSERLADAIGEALRAALEAEPASR